MQKEDKIEIESEPAEKNRIWKILITVLIILLLVGIAIVLTLNVYDLIVTNKNETNITDINITDVPSNNGSNINITNSLKTSVCGDGKCNGTENYTNCARDCKKSNPRGRDNTPPCISDCNGKNCGDDGCGESCGPCTNGICNATGRCVAFVNCTADINCTAFTGNCGTGKCNTTTKQCYSSFNSSTTICRNNVSECDSAELCTGSSANCGNDLNKSEGTACSSGTCNNGKCVDTPVILSGFNITKDGITWYFDKEYQFGQFANGDYWVKTDERGIVNITRITPDFFNDGTYYHHGWQVNPRPEGYQGFDSRTTWWGEGRFWNLSLVPSLPYLASGNQSIVKVISREPLSDNGLRPNLKVAAVLTVLNLIPENNGATVFRPPYVGNEKPLISTSKMNLNLLPSIAQTGINVPTLNGYTGGPFSFKGVQLDHVMSPEVGRYHHPYDNLPDYGTDIANRNTNIAIRLMLNDSVESKRNLSTQFVQYGIDLYYMVKNGGRWRENGGHDVGRKLPIGFAAVLLNNNEMKNVAASTDDDLFGENRAIEIGSNSNFPLYAQDRIESYITPGKYWEMLEDRGGIHSGSKTIMDPYGYIDGDMDPGNVYLPCCVSSPIVGFALANHLFPELGEVINDHALFDFADRYVQFGVHTQPDPCAPPTGICTVGSLNPGANCTMSSSIVICGSTDACNYSAKWSTDYGVLYGDNGSGGCILDTNLSDGIGRIPQNNGINANFFYGHSFEEWVNQMWQIRLGFDCVYIDYDFTQKKLIYNCDGATVNCYGLTSCASYPNQRACDYDPCNLGCNGNCGISGSVATLVPESIKQEKKGIWELIKKLLT